MATSDYLTELDWSIATSFVDMALKTGTADPDMSDEEAYYWIIDLAVMHAELRAKGLGCGRADP